MFRHQPPPHDREPPAAAARRGLTLFEVLLSLAILVGSLAAIGQLIVGGGRGAIRARLLTQAVFLAESQMAELVSGSIPLMSSEGVPLASDSAWTVSVSVGSGPSTGISTATVTVTHKSNSDLGNVTYALTRLVRDPATTLATRFAEAERLAAEQEAEAQLESQSASSGGGSGGAGGSTGGGSTTGAGR